MKHRTDEEISSYIETIKGTARRDMMTIHLWTADFECVERRPSRFDCVRQQGGNIVTVFNGALVRVVGIDDTP